MFSIAVNASRVAAIPRAGSRAAARPARVAVAARASVGSDGSLVFTSADFDAGTSTSVAVAERDEAVEEAAEEAAEASTPEPVAEQAAEPVASTKPSMATHATLIEQLPAAFGSVALITLASLAPKLRANPIAPRDGITEDAEAFFVFRSDAERLNGRAAMVGITAWALIEAVTGTAAL